MTSTRGSDGKCWCFSKRTVWFSVKNYMHFALVFQNTMSDCSRIVINTYGYFRAAKPLIINRENIDFRILKFVTKPLKFLFKDHKDCFKIIQL